MNKSKQELYCKYIDYLDDHYSDFRYYLDRTCVKGSLRTPKDKRFDGITILIPASDEIKAELNKALNSSDNDAWNKGPQILRNCIIYGHFPTGAEFKAQQDDIVTSNKTKLQIKDISGDTITLEGGCKIVRDKNFKQVNPESAKKVALWVIKSGVPVDSGIAAEYKYSGAKKTGSRETNEPGLERLTNRDLYFHAIISAYHLVVERAKSGEQQFRMPLLEYSASLIKFIMSSPKYKEYLPDAMSVCNMGYSDIVFLLEPYCAIDRLLPDCLIDEWWAQSQTAEIASTYKAAFAACAGHGACFDRRLDIVGRFNKYRMTHEASMESFTRLVGLYTTLSTGNQLFDVNNIFPERVARRYQDYPHLKLNEDDRRFLWEVRFMNYEQVYGSGRRDLDDIVVSIELFGKHKGALNALSTIVLNINKTRKHVTSALETVITPIYNSNLALYIPGIQALPDHLSDVHEAGGDSFIDYNAYNLHVVEHIYSSGVVADINSLNRMALQMMLKADRKFVNTGL